MILQTWVTVLINAPQKARTKVRKSVLDGMKYFRAKWQKIGTKPEDFKLISLNKEVEQFVKSLEKQTGLDFVGFVPDITYIKETGSQDQLDVLWEHPFGSPALLYAHKELPVLIIAGPDIMFNDSIVKSLNKYRDVPLKGITG